MFGFGKKKKHEESAQQNLEQVTEQEEQLTTEEPKTPSEAEETAQTPEESPEEELTTSYLYDRSAGPWDVSEQQETEGYMDFGAMRIKMVNGLNMRLDIEQKSQQLVAVTLTKGQGTLQVQAFAAPKSRGIWDDIRQEIANSVREQGGSVQILDGSLGRQLVSRISAQTPDGRKGFRVARFAGVDGPRWFLRGVFAGDAAIKPEAVAEMEEVFRSIVVVRGQDPRPPRELLPMTVPASIQEAQQQAQQQSSVQGKEEPPKMPRRGPEITEIG
ncbi:DUF3710 domain-containing protein [Rothia sp. P6271]|uniref:DUF3710 domain-containing protein n=1 Tax=Rothia sp. P6271 TaxID=3402659 RepID=UPI003AC3C644